MNYKIINEEVYYTTDNITKVDAKDIQKLKLQASQNLRKRVRFCCHGDKENILHEMLIVHAKGAYVPPHKHNGKIESFHIIEGELDVVILDDKGDIYDIIEMGQYGSNREFYYRLSEERFHTVLPRSEYVVFHETTNGPFDRKDTIFAPWAPEENDSQKVLIYLHKLEEKIQDFSGRRVA